MAAIQLAPSDVCRDLDAAIDRIARVAPGSSQRAAGALDTFVAAWAASREGPHAGRLTGDGFPVEIVWNTRDRAVRYTCEAAGHGVAPRSRLQALRQLLPAVGIDRPSPIAHLQDGVGELEWGAWIGGRHTASADSYKAYVEAPRELSPRARASLRDALGRHGTLLDSHVYTLRFVGFDPVAAQIELYFRAPTLRPEELRRLMAFAGVGESVDDLLSLLEAASPGPARERLPGSQHGFSLAFKAAAVRAFSLFTFASSVFGSDADVRKGLLALAERRGWDAGLYDAVTEPLAARQASGPHHGILSWMVPREGPVGVAVGLRPPRADAGDVQPR